MSSQPAAKSTSQSSFTLFPLLPTELRIQIWEAHLTLSYNEPRIILLEPSPTGYTTPLVLVNRESYRTTLYWARRQGHRDGVRPWDRKPQSSKTHYCPRLFFRASDPNRDILFFLDKIFDRPWTIPHGDSDDDDDGFGGDVLMSQPRKHQYQQPFKHIVIITHQFSPFQDVTWLANFWLKFRMEILFVVVGTMESYIRLLASFRCGSRVGHWFGSELSQDMDADTDMNMAMVRDWDARRDEEAQAQAQAHAQPQPQPHSQSRPTVPPWLVPKDSKTRAVVVGASIWDLETRRFTCDGCPGFTHTGKEMNLVARASAEMMFLNSPLLVQTLVEERVTRFEIRYVY
jgi:predicted metal-binding protein